MCFSSGRKRKLASSKNRPPVATDCAGDFLVAFFLIEQDTCAQGFGAFEGGVKA